MSGCLEDIGWANSPYDWQCLATAIKAARVKSKFISAVPALLDGVLLSVLVSLDGSTFFAEAFELSIQD
jgi:hypothetical protein